MKKSQLFPQVIRRETKFPTKVYLAKIISFIFTLGTTPLVVLHRHVDLEIIMIFLYKRIFCYLEFLETQQNHTRTL